MSFDQFWAKWPNKVAKKSARRAWIKAIKIASLEKIMAGVDRYMENKPAWQNWMHPATFLNGERWEDVYAEPEPQPLDWWERNANTERIRAEVAKLRERGVTEH